MFKKANEQGTVLEAERIEDIAFLLPRIPALAEHTADPALAGKIPLILAGYGAGGSALALFAAANADFSERFSTVKGIITVESRFWSLYRAEPPLIPEPPKGAPWYLRLKMALTKRLSGFKRRRITGFGQFSPPGVPLLCLVSDRAAVFSRRAGSPARDNPYRALLDTLRNASGPAALAAIKGAGPLDYSDYPLSHPLYSFMFPGQEKNAATSANPPADTASIIGNFAALLLERETAAAAEPEPPLIIPEKHSVSADVYVETWGLPDFLHFF